MVRGHAEALMPLIDRVMKAAGVPFGTRPHRGDHRPRQFHRIARRPIGRARARACREQARRGCDHVVCLAALVGEKASPGDFRDRCTARSCLFQVVSGAGGTLVGRVSHRSKRLLTQPGLARRFWSAMRRASWPNAGLPLRSRRWKSRPQPAPDIAGVAWLGAAVSPNTAPARPTICAPRTPNLRPFAAKCRAAAIGLIAEVAFRPVRQPPSVEAAMPARHAGWRNLHGASFHRGWGEGEFEQMLRDRNTLVHRLRLGRHIIGFSASRIAAEEAEILSIAIAPAIAAAACRANCFGFI